MDKRNCIVGIISCASTLCLVFGAISKSWWKFVSLNLEIGLLSITTQEGTFYRSSILKFYSLDDPRGVEKDIILILIIIGGGFSLLSFFIAVFLPCFGNGPCWFCGCTILFITTLLAGGCSLAASIFAEINFKSDWKQSEHGYSAQLTWAGSVLCVITFISSFLILCRTPDD
ncbi:uncharacterized protein LOC105848959 [Hydra vulgaris]|uniref:uncharacterized protein LOC105848959 n=1 Tax=Hydra vulgaris TaxID=6087 RepID=UPI000640E80B|nr:uncharacterized protein LOC105848959 [Hydra vulgaris]